MTRPSRFLETAAPPPQPSEQMLAAESDMVVILSALLCALICVAGLAAVLRCAWLRRFTSQGDSPPSSNKGLKKKALQSLPRSTFTSKTEPSTSGAGDGDTTECAICLTEFSDGEEIRVLPLCGHCFHVACIDKWLSSRSSCPSCRRILTSVRCDRCGHASSTAETQNKEEAHRHQHHQHSSSVIPAFLP